MKSVTHSGGIVVLLTILLTLMCLTQPAFSEPNDIVAGNMMLMNDNGGWCWYQDDKIIYDPVAGNVLISTAPDDTGFGGVGGTRLNDMDSTTFNIDTGKRTRFNAHENFGGDDHNMGAFWIRPDGRYMHIYCQHYNDPQVTYLRLATNPNDGSSWGTEYTYNWETISGLTDTLSSSYTNVYYLSGEGTGMGRLYNIIRVFERTPCVSYSDDWGVTWNYMGRINGITGTTTYSNFYHKFTSNGVDRIDFIGSEQHPRNYNNGVYHGYIKNGKSYNSFGVEIDTINDQNAPAVGAFTAVFTPDPCQLLWHTGWANEMELDKNGYPVCLYQTRYGTETWGDGSGQNNIGAADHRFFYGRFNGTTWTSTELCRLGGGLHLPEQDYTGMGCIHPDDANIVYVSTQFDPRDDTESYYREIFKGVTYDNGATWNWTQITFDSSINNTRPAVPPWDANNTAVVWTRGNWVQTSYENYDLVAVGIIEEEDRSCGICSYIDANSNNTENADGSVFSPTGPSGSAGAVDSRWHEYTGYGNGGSCYTAGDGGIENVPTIKTTVTDLNDGIYDVYAYFWCAPNLDWGIRGGFTSAESDMLCFNKQSSQHAEASQFSGTVTVSVTGYQLYRVYIGRTVVSGGTPINVYLDNYDSSYVTNIPTRTTYDGIGVATVSYAGPADSTPPTPNPMTWSSVPTATGARTITMTATTATDSQTPPVLYYFECTTDSTKNSGWQASPTYVASGLTPSTQYSFRVKACDYYNTPNATGWSSTLSATTEAAPVEILGLWGTGTTHAKETGTDRALVFTVHAEGNTSQSMPSVTSVTYGGQTMTKVVEIVNPSGSTTRTYTGAFILNDAGITAASTTTFSVTWGTAAASSAFGHVFLQNVNQSTLTGATASNAATTGATITTSSLANSDGDMVIDAATCSSSGSYTVNNGFTEAQELTITNADAVDGYKSATGVNETPSVTYSSSSVRQTLVGFVVKLGAAPDLPPAAPTGLTATGSYGQVSLNWDDNAEADLDGYNVYRSTTQGSGYGKLNVVLVADSNYIDSDVVNGTPYYYVVTAVDVNEHESGNSNEATATPGYQNCAEVIAAGYGLTSDLTGDCYVDFEDLDIIVNYWLATDCTEPTNCDGADFEPADGAVDLSDYSNFAVQWLECNDPGDEGCTPNW